MIHAYFVPPEPLSLEVAIYELLEWVYKKLKKLYRRVVEWPRRSEK